MKSKKSRENWVLDFIDLTTIHIGQPEPKSLGQSLTTNAEAVYNNYIMHVYTNVC